MMCNEIHVWGDSLARGIVYREEQKRYAISRERCTTRLAQSLPIKVENHSGMGATVLEGLKWFDDFTGAPGALCAIEFGGNDCDLDWAKVAENPEHVVKARVPLQVFEESIARFVKEVRKRDMEAVLVTPLPLHSERYFQWVTKGLNAQAVLAALGDVHHIYRWQERYANAVRAVARALGVRMLDLRDVLLAQPDYENLICLDGVHPNDEGHRRLSDAVMPLAQARFAAAIRLADQEASEAHLSSIPSACMM